MYALWMDFSKKATVSIWCMLLCMPYALAASNIININNNNKTFSIKLKANPTTGYQWFIKYYNKKLIVCNNKNYTANSKLIGAGGITTFNFTAKNTQKPFSTNIQFIYKRPWEKNISAQSQTYTIKYNPSSEF